MLNYIRSKIPMRNGYTPKLGRDEPEITYCWGQVPDSGENAKGSYNLFTNDITIRLDTLGRDAQSAMFLHEMFLLHELSHWANWGHGFEPPEGKHPEWTELLVPLVGEHFEDVRVNVTSLDSQPFITFG